MLPHERRTDGGPNWVERGCFHPGKLLLSVPFRALQVAIIGVQVPVLLAWDAGTLLTAWDRLHRTFAHGASQQATVIGLAGPRSVCFLRSS